jgi:dUTP pyrophosphatase
MIADIKFAQLRPDAIIPSKRDEDSGLDVYACFDADWIEILPHSSKLIPTGIASAFDHDWSVVFKERSSTGVKNIKVNAGVIDSGFRGEYKVCIYNGNDVPLYITKYMDGEQAPEAADAILYPYNKAIAQALVLPNPSVKISIVDYSELQSIASERGDGMIGSSGK